LAATVIVAASILPETIVGETEASTPRGPSIPKTRSRASTVSLG
jgi:hypothetical protein